MLEKVCCYVMSFLVHWTVYCNTSLCCIQRSSVTLCYCYRRQVVQWHCCITYIYMHGVALQSHPYTCCKYLKSNWVELSPGSRQEVNLHCEHSKFLLISPTMKITNFWLERECFTVKVSSEGAFKDKNNVTVIFKIVCWWSNYNKKISNQLQPLATVLSQLHPSPPTHPPHTHHQIHTLHITYYLCTYRGDSHCHVRL